MAKIIIIEPLRYRMAFLLKNGERSILSKSQALFGTEEDIATLCSEIDNAHSHKPPRAIVVDMTSLLTCGTQTRLQSIVSLAQRIPFLLVAKRDLLAQYPSLVKSVSAVVLSEGGKVIDSAIQNKWKRSLEPVIKQYLSNGRDFLEVHSEWSESVFMSIVKGAVRVPPVGDKLLPLHEGAWANKWIDVKQLLHDPNMAFFIAYQMAYIATHGFSAPLEADAIVVGNNTAYCMATLIHHIFDYLDLIVIDRLGPFARLPEAFLLGLERINRKRLCMVEDVISTGREIDLMQMLIYLEGAQLTTVVALFDLEISRCRLVHDTCIHSLCRPSVRIQYKRKPRFLKHN